MINHGVIPSLVENVKRDVQEFLNLPMEKKKQFWQIPDELEGFGQLFVVSEDQKLEWADMFFIHTLPINARNLRLFPNFPQPLRLFPLSVYIFWTAICYISLPTTTILMSNM